MADGWEKNHWNKQQKVQRGSREKTPASRCVMSCVMTQPGGRSSAAGAARSCLSRWSLVSAGCSVPNPSVRAIIVPAVRRGARQQPPEIRWSTGPKAATIISGFTAATIFIHDNQHWSNTFIIVPYWLVFAILGCFPHPNGEVMVNCG